MDEMNRSNPFSNHQYSQGQGRQQQQQMRSNDPQRQQPVYEQQASGGYQPQPQYRQPYDQGYAQSAPVQFGNPRTVVPVPPEKKKSPWVKIVIAFLIGLVLGFAGGSAGRQSSKGVDAGEEKSVATATSKDDEKQDEKQDGTNEAAPVENASANEQSPAPVSQASEPTAAPQEAAPIEEPPAEKFSVNDEALDTSNQFSASITGVLVNNTDTDYHYVQIEYILYDAAGNQIGTAFANISNLKAGGSWKFSAMTLKAPEELGRYERGEITAW